MLELRMMLSASAFKASTKSTPLSKVLSLTRPPSAELRPDQTDQDNLPEYDVIDGIIERYVEQNQSSAEVVAAGYSREAVEQIVRLIRINEYKRRQSPPGPRITNRAYGRDWRYPLSNGFRDTPYA